MVRRGCESEMKSMMQTRDFRLNELARYNARTRWQVGILLLIGLWATSAAQAVEGLKLQSLTPGELSVEWTAPNTNPTDYRVVWARADQAFPSWRDSSGNAYPTSPSYTVTGLQPDREYKVKVRARYGVSHPQGLRSDPFSDQATQRIDDYSGDVDTTGTLTMGEPHDAWIASGGDVDWFAAQLEGTRRYDITVDGDEGLGAQLISVYDDQGAVVRQGVDWSGMTALVFRPQDSGTYFISVAGTDEQTGSYTLLAEDVPRDTISGLSLASNAPGELTITWDEADLTPSDYRIIWAKDGENYQSWRSSDGNAYPTGASYVITGLDSDAVYKVQVRARYYRGDYTADPWSGPWSVETTLTVASEPVTTPEPELEPEPETAQQQTTEPEISQQQMAEPEIARQQTDEVPETRDSTIPTLISITVDGASLVLTYDRALDANSAPASSQFTVTVAGTARTVSDVSVRALAVTLTLSSSVAAGETVAVTYTVPSTNPIQDEAGNDVAGLTNEAATNNTMALDIPDDDSSTTGVSVGGSVDSSIDHGSDRDWISVTLSVGRVYRFDVLGAVRADGDKRSPEVTDRLWDSNLTRIIDPNGVPIPRSGDDNSGNALDSRVYLSPKSEGVHFVEVAGNSGYTGDYTLSVTDVTDSHRDDYASDTDTEGTVAVSNSVTGTLEFAGDSDWFAVSLQSGKTYRAELSGTGASSGTSNLGIYGVHASETSMLPDTADIWGQSFNNNGFEFVVPRNGTYYVAVGAPWPFETELTYLLTLSDVTDSTSDDYSAGTSTSGVLEVGVPLNGRIHYRRDQDWFRVSLDAGDYTVSVEPNFRLVKGIPVVDALYDDSGNKVVANGPVQTSLRFSVEDAGTYYVAVAAVPIFVTFKTVNYQVTIRAQ